jgi:hypothetical protein
MWLTKYKEKALSISFRPVKEVWGESSSCFISPDEVADRLRKLAEDHLRGVVYKYEYGDVISLWIEEASHLSICSNAPICRS